MIRHKLVHIPVGGLLTDVVAYIHLLFSCIVGTLKRPHRMSFDLKGSLKLLVSLLFILTMMQHG